MTHLLKVDGSRSVPCQRTSMSAESLTETSHLEQWITDNPQVIDESLKIVTTQFRSWTSQVGTATERPDLLALSTSGELAVIELKRDRDRRIHLQAITYGALVAGFTVDTLSQAHADWLNKNGAEYTLEQARAALEDHVEDSLDEELFRLPRLVLVAEDFPGQVLTTVQWLATVAPDLVIECHQYQVFDQADQLVVSFGRIYPVDDLEDRKLRPSAQALTDDVREELTTRKRRAKSVKVIFDHDLIPANAQMTIELHALARPDVVDKVTAWLAADPARTQFTWHQDPTKPLQWAVEPDKQWTPSALRNHIFVQAGLPAPSFSAADAWCYDGESLWRIADRVSQGE